MRCERCDGSGIFYIGVRNMKPIKAKPNDGMCYRCLDTGIDPYLTEETNNKTTMKEEGGTMMNYKEMNWKEIVAYAKEMGINTGHKKRTVIEEELAAMGGAIVTQSGDMATDKYYPELQADVTKPVLNMKQGYLIIKYLSNKGKTYKATTLHGVLAQYNGHTTMKLSVLRAIVANTLRITEGEPTKERIDAVLDEMVRLKYFGRAYSENNVPQFFINKEKCNALLTK